MKAKIVRFKDGTYGFRKFSLLYLGWVFLDLETDLCCWWPIKSRYFRGDCKGTRAKVCARIECFKVLIDKDYGEVE